MARNKKVEEAAEAEQALINRGYRGRALTHALAALVGGLGGATLMQRRMNNDKLARRVQRENDYVRAREKSMRGFSIGSRGNSMQSIRGKGGYSVGRAIASGLGSGIGGLGGAAAGTFGGPAGTAIGGAVGSSLGALAGEGFADITGMGDYSVKVNTLGRSSQVIEGEEIPTFGALGHGTRVKHREYIKDILVPATPTTFVNTEYVINPGNAQLFPWLAAVAAQYQQYEFNGLVFMFKSLSSDVTAGGALGSVVMATNYDVLETKFSDKVVMENSQYAVSAKPSRSQVHAVECDPKARVTKLQYVRDGSSSTTTSQDNRFYDLGKFQVATAGLPGSAGQVLGELWATYDVTLYKPEIVVDAPTEALGINSADATHPFGASAASITGVQFFQWTSANTITALRSGTYLVEYVVAGVGITNVAFSGTATYYDGDAGPATTRYLSIQTVAVVPGSTIIVTITATSVSGAALNIVPADPVIWQ